MMGASAEVQPETEQEKSLLKKGLADEARAREKSQPLLTEYDRKMNRDDTNRIAGATNADIMQNANATSTGQTLAAGQGQQQRSTGLGQGLVDGGLNAAVAGKTRQDGMKSNYNAMGNKRNMATVDGMGTAASAASHVAGANANAKQTENQALFDAVTQIGASYGFKKFDKWDQANDKVKAYKANPGDNPMAERQSLGQYKQLVNQRDKHDLFGVFNWLDGWK